MDRRQKKTRKAVLLAFETLSAQKKYDDITVQDIINLADIGRTTFYAHFETKDSLLDALCSDLFAHIFDEHLSEENTHDFSQSEHSEENMLTHILYHLKEDKVRYKRLFNGESAEIFWNRFKIWFQKILAHQLQSGKWRCQRTLPAELYRQLYVSSFVEIVKWWFKHSCQEAPEQVEAYFEDFCGLSVDSSARSAGTRN